MRLLSVRRLQALLFGVLLGIGLCCAAAGTAEAASRTIAVSRTPMSLPFYVALQQGFFRDEGLDLILADCLGAYRCLRQVQDGRSDFATASDILVSLAAFRDRNWRVLAGYASSQDELRLVVRRGAELGTPQQLVGLRVGVVPATASQYFFDALLLTQDVDPHAVRQIPMQPEEAARLLARGQVDAIAVWEPFASYAMTAVGAGAAVMPNHSGYKPTFTLVAGRALGQSAQEDEVRLLRGLDRAIAYIQREPGKAREVLRQRLQLDDTIAARIFSGMQFRLHLDANLVKTMESAGRWAVRERHVVADSQPDYSALVDAEPLRKARPQALAIGRHP